MMTVETIVSPNIHDAALGIYHSAELLVEAEKMTKKIPKLMAYVTSLGLAVAWLGTAGMAGDKANYSGKYSMQAGKATPGSASVPTLEVIQNQSNIEITRVEDGKRTSNKYPLDGSEGDYKSPGGVLGKCKAQWKGKYLVLESVVVSRPDASAPPVRVHTKEQWQLSADSNTLTVKSNVDFPDFPGELSKVAGAYGSGTQKYIRTANP